MLFRAGLSFIEILIVVLFLSLVLLGLFSVNAVSNKSSMDSYYEFIAFQLAREPIEVLRAFGYAAAVQYGKSFVLPDYPLNDWAPVWRSKLDGIQYPADAAFFQRKILVTTVEGSPKAVKISVEVAPIEASRASIWLTNDVVKLEGLIVETP